MRIQFVAYSFALVMVAGAAVGQPGEEVVEPAYWRAVLKSLQTPPVKAKSEILAYRESRSRRMDAIRTLAKVPVPEGLQRFTWKLESYSHAAADYISPADLNRMAKGKMSGANFREAFLRYEASRYRLVLQHRAELDQHLPGWIASIPARYRSLIPAPPKDPARTAYWTLISRIDQPENFSCWGYGASATARPEDKARLAFKIFDESRTIYRPLLAKLKATRPPADAREFHDRYIVCLRELVDLDPRLMMALQKGDFTAYPLLDSRMKRATEEKSRLIASKKPDLAKYAPVH